QINDNDFCIELCDNETESEQAINSLLSKSIEHNWSLAKMSPRVRSLEQIFIELTVNNDSHSSQIKETSEEIGGAE
ncbi:MAG: hypothetical protein KAU21_10080, partial [Gammaproteobacteria bacterium]|nr:hypothetical protein [Gammaproteobacteria bacterium]